MKKIKRDGEEMIETEREGTTEKKETQKQRRRNYEEKIQRGKETERVTKKRPGGLLQRKDASCEVFSHVSMYEPYFARDNVVSQEKKCI